MRADGRLLVRPQSARAALFHDCPPGRADTAITLLRPQTPATGTQPATAAAWRNIPSTYIRCTQTGCPTNSSALPTGSTQATCSPCPQAHCPQWSRPDLVADLLWSIISSARPDAPC